MSQFIVDKNIEKLEDSEDEDAIDRNNIDNLNNYKGIFCNEDSEDEQRYFEFGAHFPYKWLCQRLEELSRDLTPRTNSLNTTAIKNEIEFAHEKGINKEVNFRRISTKDTKQSVGNERRVSGKKINPSSGHSNNNMNQSNNFNKRFLLPREPVNKIPSVSLLNNASMSNIMENNILSFLNDNLNNIHKSRNVNKKDNVYNVGTNAVHDGPKRLINKENECSILSGDKKTVLAKNNLNSNFHKDNSEKAEQNKIVTCTFKKEEKKNIDNLHVFTSYTNACKKSENIYKPLFVKKNGNLVLDNKNVENSQNIPIVVVEKNSEEKKVIKYKFDNFFKTNNQKKISSMSKDKKSSSPNKENQIINTYISKLNSFKNRNDSSKGNIIIPGNAKIGRNINKNKLNPHNTNVSQTKTISQTTSINKNKIDNPELTKFKHELKKLTLDKIFRISENNYVTASLGIKKNIDVIRLKANPLDNKSLSPGKIKLETNRVVLVEKEKTKSCSREELKTEALNINQAEENEKIKNNIGLNEIMSNLTKNNETKSRNAQRNHIAITSSNPFSSDKAQSMQNVSYQKTDILSSQLHKKNITLMKHVNNCNPKPKPKTIAVVNKSFTSNLTIKLNKKTKANNVNKNTAKNKVNNITIWSVSDNKKIQFNFATSNAANTNINHNEFNSKKTENILTIKSPNSKPNYKQNEGKSEMKSPPQKKLINFENTNLKNKSNSLQANLDLGKGIGISLIKNYKIHNNPTKISYNSKKNETSVTKCIYASTGSKKNSFGLINIFSTKSNKL